MRITALRITWYVILAISFSPVLAFSQTLPSPWINQDVGTGGRTGSSTFSSGVFTLAGSGVIYSSSDTTFQYAYQPLNGDGQIVARITYVQNTDAWAKAGLMFRQSLAANSTNASTFISPTNGSFLSYRVLSGGTTSGSATVSSTAPYWLKMVRRGSTFTGYGSSDGVSWITIGSVNINMTAQVYVGLVTSSNSPSLLCTGTFDNVSVNGFSPVPTPWSDQDIGTPGFAGSADFDNGAFTVNGTGVMWLGSDQFNSVAQPVSGNGGIIARVTSVQNTDPWAKAGVMIRETLAANATNAIMALTPQNGTVFQFRSATGGSTAEAGTVVAGTAPYWVKLIRNGNTFSGYASADGANWVQTATQTISMANTAYFGLEVSSNTSSPNTSSFDDISIFGPPSIAGMSPNTGITGTEVVISGSGFGSSQGSNTVTMNGVAPAILSWSDTQITARITSGTRTGPALITVSGLQSNTPIFSVPVPQITAFTPATGLSGTQVTITGSGFAGWGVPPTASVGAIPAAVSSYDDSHLTLTIPDGDPSGQITVNEGEVSATSSGYLGPCPNDNSPNSCPCVTHLAIGGAGLVGGSNQTARATVQFNKVGGNAGVNPADQNGSGYAFGFSCTNGEQPFSGTFGEGCLGGGANPVLVDLIAPGYVPSDQSMSVNVNADGCNDPGKDAPLLVKQMTVSLSATPSVLRSGSTDQGSGTVTLNAPIAENAISLSVSPSGAVQVPGVVYTDASGRATFSVTPGSLSSPTDVTITASFNNSLSTANLQVWNGENEMGACPDCESTAGHPINLTNGNVWITQNDYSLPGLGGGISLSRTWNSFWDGTQNVEQAGLFGDSWRSTFEERIQVMDLNHLKYWRADGSSWLFSYVGDTWTLQAPANQHVSLNFDSTTHLYTFTNLDGRSRTFNDSGYLTAISDRNGNTATVAYDASNRITQVIDAAGRVLTFNYPNSSTHQVQSIQDATGVIATYAYDSSLRLLSVTYADASVLNYNYDGNSLITSVTDGSGKVVEAHTYDSSRRGLTSQEANGVGAVTVAYTAPGSTQLTDSLGNITTYSYGIYGNRRVTTAVSGSGCSTCGGKSTQIFGYDASGNRTSVVDANGVTSTYGFDGNGNMTSSIRPLDSTHNQIWQYTYNSLGEVLTATDPLSNTTTNTYDPHGNLLTTTTPSPDGGVTPGSKTTFTYDSKGELLTVTDPLNHTTTFTYTTAGLIQTIKDAQNHVTTYGYDARDNRTSITDAANNQTTFAYDPRNRLKTITYPDQTTTQYGYDTRGRRTSVTDQNGKVTTYAYDDADRLVSVTDAQTPTHGVTQYGYDTENNLTSIMDAMNRVTSFSYDKFRRVKQTTFPSTLSEMYTYDGDDNLQTKTDRNGNTITYVYDNLNRMTTKQYPGSGGSVSYSYDLANRLTHVSDSTGTYGFSYDNMGRLTGTTTQYSFLPGQTFTNSYSYDAASNRTGFTAPDGSTNTYAYDTLNRLSTLTNSVTGQFGFGYDALSRRTSLTRPNGVSTSYSYDSLSRLLSILHQSGGTTIDGASYTLDNAGNRTSKLNWLNGITENYSYDPTYQLTQVQQIVNGTPNTTESYAYDLVGNRQSSLNVASYSYNSSNQLTSSSDGNSYTYDANGNTLSKSDSSGTTQYGWDFENHLTSVTLPNGGGAVSFRYDPLGRRIQKTSPTGTTTYLYEGDSLIEELDGSGSLLARYAQGPSIDEPLTMLRGGATSFYNFDGLGSITSLANTTGTLTQTYSFDTFGKRTAANGSITNPFQYSGREFDSETGLLDLRARYYDSTAGRFLSEDPLGFGGGTNFYQYAMNQPTDFIDPFGLLAELYCDKVRIMRGGWKAAPLMLAFRPTHCFIRVKCKSYDRIIQLAGPPRLPDGSFGKYGIPMDNQFYPGAIADANKYPIHPPANMGCCEFEDLLLDKFQRAIETLPPYSGYPGPNSNTFANQIITSAGGTADFPSNAYGSNFGNPVPLPVQHTPPAPVH